MTRLLSSVLTITALLPTDGRPLPGAPCVVQDMTVQLAPGSRCLLIGPNGTEMLMRLLYITPLTSSCVGPGCDQKLIGDISQFRCWQDVLAADPSWQAQGARGRCQCAGATAVLCHRTDHQRRHSLHRRQLGAGCCLCWIFRPAAGVLCLSMSERQSAGAWLQAACHWLL